MVCESCKCFESGSYWQDEASTSRGAQFIGAPATTTARGDDDCSVVQDDASFSTLRASEVTTKSRQVSEILFGLSSQCSLLLPTLLQPISLTLELSGTVLLLVAVRSRIPIPKDLLDMDKLAVIEQHSLPDKNFIFPVRVQADIKQCKF